MIMGEVGYCSLRKTCDKRYIGGSIEVGKFLSFMLGFWVRVHGSRTWGIFLISYGWMRC